MKKRLFTMALVALTLNASAQEKSTKWYDNIKFSGYGMLQYQAEDKEGGEHNEFNLRLMRMILDGKIGEFDYRAQIQGTNVKGPGEPTVQLVDLYTEWVKHKEFRVKVGQFKRAFTFENPTNPITQGWYAYALAINNLSGFGDRTGEKSSGGRDIGLQVQGDLLPNANGRRLLHYQVGVYNGEGINQKDKDQRKDIIGGLWVMPIQGVRIGAFGWTGSADPSLGDKADGWYAFGIVPVIKSKLHAKARYNCYRKAKEWDSSKTMYEVGLNYYFTKNLQLNAEYARVNDRSIADPDKHNYNFVDVQLDFRF